MSNIFDASGNKMATIGEDGKVYNTMQKELGYVSSSHDVYNGMGQKVGNLEADGHISKAGHHVGVVHGNGMVYDMENHYVGKIVGDHVEIGAAALLLLVV